MKIILVALCAFLNTFAAYSAEVTCYNDDSQDSINQDEFRLTNWGGWASTPDPTDCASGPIVTIQESFGSRRGVSVDGKLVYSDNMDPVVEARVAPTGVVALQTERGKLLVYRANAGLKTWYDGRIHAIRAFRLARDGSLIGATTDGELVLNGNARFSVKKVVRLYASANGRVVALMDDGTVEDSKGELYTQRIDPAQAVKLAADGTVVWLTRRGAVGSTRDSNVFSGFVDPAEYFKVNPAGHVAYVTREGHLGRDGVELSERMARVLRFKIHSNGAVTSVDQDGNSRFYR